jgi:hypothetical protein
LADERQIGFFQKLLEATVFFSHRPEAGTYSKTDGWKIS